MNRFIRRLCWRPAGCCCGPATGRLPSGPPVDPPYPRIGNCYGAQLTKKWEEGREYWSKLGLIVGGGYDLHYDWENPRWTKTLRTVEENIARLRTVNPHVLVLPYVDVIEGPDNPNVPKHWWDLDPRENAGAAGPATSASI